MVNFPGTLQFRDDSTIYMLGYYDDNGKKIPGYWYQKYIPQEILQNDYARDLYSQEAFSHKWQFVTKETFRVMDKYYNFGIYDAYDEKYKPEGGYFPFHRDRAYYAYQGIDECCQYYTVDAQTESETDFIKSIISHKTIEWEPEHDVHNPYFAGYDAKEKIHVTLRWALS